MCRAFMWFGVRANRLHLWSREKRITPPLSLSLFVYSEKQMRQAFRAIWRLRPAVYLRPKINRNRFAAHACRTDNGDWFSQLPKDHSLCSYGTEFVWLNSPGLMKRWIARRTGARVRLWRSVATREKKGRAVSGGNVRVCTQKACDSSANCPRLNANSTGLYAANLKVRLMENGMCPKGCYQCVFKWKIS